MNGHVVFVVAIFATAGIAGCDPSRTSDDRTDSDLPGRATDSVAVPMDLDPADPRIRDFVAWLRRNGVTLEHIHRSDGLGDWKVTKPSNTDEYDLVYKIASFPLSASEQQMKNALDVNLAYELNASAHLAMSSSGIRGNSPDAKIPDLDNERLPKLNGLPVTRAVEELFLKYDADDFALKVRQPVLDANRPGNASILKAAASYSDRTTSFRDSTGANVRPTYGDPMLDRAAEALSDIAQPWTLEKIMKIYRSETDLARRCHLLRAMAASRDPRVAIQLHNLLGDNSLDIRMAALSGLWDHFVQVDGMWAGGTEQMLETEAAWWNENKASITKAARTLAEQDDAPELLNGRKLKSTTPAATR